MNISWLASTTHWVEVERVSETGLVMLRDATVLLTLWLMLLSRKVCTCTCKWKIKFYGKCIYKHPKQPVILQQ